MYFERLNSFLLCQVKKKIEFCSLSKFISDLRQHVHWDSFERYYCHRTAIVTIVKIYIFESQFKCQSRVNKFDILYNIINYIERDNQ